LRPNLSVKSYKKNPEDLLLAKSVLIGVFFVVSSPIIAAEPLIDKDVKSASTDQLLITSDQLPAIEVKDETPDFNSQSHLFPQY
jgi:hypothetical protein